MPDDRSFRLEWRPGTADWEAAVRATRRATRVVWAERALALAGVALCVVALADGRWVALPPLVVLVLLGTGLWGYGYRWLFLYRRRPEMTAVCVQDVTAEGLTEWTGPVVQRTAWEAWAGRIDLGDLLVLVSATHGDAHTAVLARRGLTDPTEWADLVALVRERVPAHPGARG